MNDRPSVGALPLAWHTEAELSAIRVDRAQTELKHGRPLAVCERGREPALVVAAVETLTPVVLHWLESLGSPLELLLTPERLSAMEWQPAEAARALRLPSKVSIDTLQRLSAIRPSLLPARALHDAMGVSEAAAGSRRATAPMDAALQLAKRARLAPALVAVAPQGLLPGALEAAHLLQVSTDDVQQGANDPTVRLHRVSDARVPLAVQEDCTLVLFREDQGDAEHVAIIVGRPDFTQPVPVRLHSSCFTGDLLGSLRCDCGEQLQDAINRLSETGGVLLYLAQEGRGTGLGNKLRAYRLQDTGLDTIDADRYLGFRADERDFRAAVSMLKALGVQRVRLMTNNPRKLEAIRQGGIEVVDRISLIATANPHNARYLDTKRARAGHLMPHEEQE